MVEKPNTKISIPFQSKLSDGWFYSCVYFVDSLPANLFYNIQ